MSPWLIGCYLDFRQGLGLGPLLGAEQFGGRVFGSGVFEHGVAGQALAFGLLHRLPPGPLGGSRGAFQLVTHRLRLVGSFLGLGPLLNGGLQSDQELPLVSIQVSGGQLPCSPWSFPSGEGTAAVPP